MHMPLYGHMWFLCMYVCRGECVCVSVRACVCVRARAFMCRMHDTLQYIKSAAPWMGGIGHIIMMVGECEWVCAALTGPV